MGAVSEAACPAPTVPAPPQSQWFLPTAQQHGLQAPVAESLGASGQEASAGMRLTCHNSGFRVAKVPFPQMFHESFPALLLSLA